MKSTNNQINNFKAAKAVVEQFSSNFMLVLAEQKYGRPPRIYITYKGAAPERMGIMPETLTYIRGVNMVEIAVNNGDINMNDLNESLEILKDYVPNSVEMTGFIKECLADEELELKNVEANTYEHDQLTQTIGKYKKVIEIFNALKAEFMTVPA